MIQSPMEFINLVFYVLDGLGLNPIISGFIVMMIAITTFRVLAGRGE